MKHKWPNQTLIIRVTVMMIQKEGARCQMQVKVTEWLQTTADQVAFSGDQATRWRMTLFIELTVTHTHTQTYPCRQTYYRTDTHNHKNQAADKYKDPQWLAVRGHSQAVVLIVCWVSCPLRLSGVDFLSSVSLLSLTHDDTLSALPIL